MNPKLLSDEEKEDSSSLSRARFDLQVSDHDGHDGSRRKAGAHTSSAISVPSDSLVRPTRDTKSSAEQRTLDGEFKQNTTSVSNRSRATAHDVDVHAAASRHESMTGLHPGRTVTRYDANSPEVNIDSAINEIKPHLPDRDSTTVSAGIDTFVSHRWDKTEVPANT